MIFFLHQTGTEAHPASGSVGVSNSFSGNKATGTWC